MTKILLLTLFLFSTTIFAASEFNRAWELENSTIVIDAYQGNPINWDKMGTDRKVVGVIHRATDGTRVDTKYRSRNEIALDRGYLWGAYHLGRPGNTIRQADIFLDVVGDHPETLLILDLEATSSSSMMDIDEAVVFMNYIYEQTGKVMVVYANHTVTKELNQKLADNRLFQEAELWYARFRPEIPNFPVGIWNEYFLWQFSSEINCNRTGRCLYNVPGTLFDMDVNVFNGSKEELADRWMNAR